MNIAYEQVAYKLSQYRDTAYKLKKLLESLNEDTDEVIKEKIDDALSVTVEREKLLASVLAASPEANMDYKFSIAELVDVVEKNTGMSGWKVRTGEACDEEKEIHYDACESFGLSVQEDAMVSFISLNRDSDNPSEYSSVVLFIGSGYVSGLRATGRVTLGIDFVPLDRLFNGLNTMLW